ncbi:MAG: preprotein translocase subunit SecE [Terriglobales bacterium]
MAKSAVTQIMDAGNIGGKLKSWPLRVKAFYNDVRTEMKKVTSPSFKEVRATTVVVIVTVAIFGLYFWGIDSVIGKGVNLVFKYFRH